MLCAVRECFLCDFRQHFIYAYERLMQYGNMLKKVVGKNGQITFLAFIKFVCVCLCVFACVCVCFWLCVLIYVCLCVFVFFLIIHINVCVCVSVRVCFWLRVLRKFQPPHQSISCNHHVADPSCCVKLHRKLRETADETRLETHLRMKMDCLFFAHVHKRLSLLYY